MLLSESFVVYTIRSRFTLRSTRSERIEGSVDRRLFENVTLSCCVSELEDSIIKIMGNIIYSIIWLIILILVAFWLAGIAAGFYVLLLPLTVCIEPLSGLTDFLLTVIQFPKYCAQAMMDGRGFR